MSELIAIQEMQLVFDAVDSSIGVFDMCGQFVFGNSEFHKCLLKIGVSNDREFHADEMEWEVFGKKRKIFWRDLLDTSQTTSKKILVTFTDRKELYQCKISKVQLYSNEFYLIDLHEQENPCVKEDKIMEHAPSFLSMLDEFPVMICGADNQGVLKYWNKQCTDVLGYSKEDILNDPSVVDKMYPNLHYRRQIEEKIYRKENGSIRHVHVDVITKQGTQKTISWNLKYTTHPILEDVHYWLVGSDATGLYKAMNTLIESEERFSQISKASNDAVWDWNLKTNELWWNEGMSELFGYNAAEIENTYAWWLDRLHPSFTDSVNEKLMEAIQSKSEFWCDEYLFRKKDGTYAFIFDKGYIIKDDKGDPVRFIGGMVDITSIKQP